MNVKQKFEKAKKKYEENQPAFDAAIIAGCLATASFCLYVIKRVNDVQEHIAVMREEVEMGDAIIRDINDSAKHVRETGHSVTFYNGHDEPVFVMTPVPDEN